MKTTFIEFITEVAVARTDPEMDEYYGDEDAKDQDMRDAPYYVGWSGQSHEWYGDLNTPGKGNGRYKAKGDGGDIVAKNVPTYAQAQEIANKLDQDYEDNKFHDDFVYGKYGEDGYLVDYHGSWINSMSKARGYDKERLQDPHIKDYSK